MQKSSACSVELPKRAMLDVKRSEDTQELLTGVDDPAVEKAAPLAEKVARCSVLESHREVAEGARVAVARSAEPVGSVRFPARWFRRGASIRSVSAPAALPRGSRSARSLRPLDCLRREHPFSDLRRPAGWHM